MSVTFIVHGAARPPAPVLEAQRQRMLAAKPGAQVIEACDEAARTHGPAAVINRAAEEASGDVLCAVEAGSLLETSALAALCDAGGNAVAVAGRRPLPEPDVPPDLIRDLAARGAPGGTPAPDVNGPMIFALPRPLFSTLGGLDARLSPVGLLDDLIERARVRGLPAVALAPEAAEAPGAWAVDPAIARALHVRDRLVTAFKTFAPDALGVELARVAHTAILDAWRASGLQAEGFAFGGDWGRGEGRLARALSPGSYGARAAANHAAILEPLLGLDAFLDLVPGLVGDRRQWAQAAPAPAPPQPAVPIQAPGTPLEAQPRVSVIVVNWNGLEHLEPCFGSLEASDYPADRLELVCVDNGSTDGSVALLRSRFPQVQVVALDSNHGFTGGNRAGVAASRGDVLVFLNNDMRVDPGTISRLVAALDPATPCVAARVLSWDGQHIDFLRGALNFEARGFQDFYGEPADGERQSTADTFFANGGAFAVTRDAYQRAGGFDPGLFAYYDDVDLGWRLRLTGSGIRVEDRAVAYHRHGATSRGLPTGQKQFLMERNALRTAIKNYGELALRRTLGVTLLLTVRRVLDDSRLMRAGTPLAALSPYSERVRRHFTAAPRPPAAGARLFSGLAAESLAALGVTLAGLPQLAGERAVVQQARTAPDAEVLAHFGRTFDSLSPVSSYQPIQKALVTGLELPGVFNARTRLLIISHEAIAANMSGPAVRFLELGRALSAVARVTIAMPGTAGVRDERCTIVGFDPDDASTLARLAGDADVLFVQGFTLTQFPVLSTLMLPIVVDLYCPFTIEHLEQTRGDARRAAQAADILAVQNAQLDAGDFFICASEIQRDFWLGNLHSRGRINPRTYEADPTLRTLIDVVPFGLPDEPLAAAVDRARAAAGAGAGAVMKGVRPGIGPGDKVLLWAGSILDWQDPLTLIRAVADVAGRRPDVKLFFMGTRHPNPLVTPMRMVEDSRHLAAELGVLDRHVFFNDWVPYDQRARYLAEADLGVSTHREHLETHFSFRTRMLDYVWAGVPIVCTRGDVFADLVTARGLGLAVEAGDAAALAHAIETLLDEGSRRQEAWRALSQLSGELLWSQVVTPLARFVASPRFAADRSLAIDAVQQRLAGKFAMTRWLKRTALRAGVSEARIQQVKRWRAVQQAMIWRNKLAMARVHR